MSPISIPGHYREQYLKRIEQSIQYINQNLAAALDLDQIAQAASFSPYHFHRIFTALVGENPQNFVNRLRLEKAANLLIKSPALPITTVALSCGFSSSSAFARSFKKYFGIAPRDYARQNLHKERPLAWVSSRPNLAEEASYALPPIKIQTLPAFHLAYFVAPKGYAQASIKIAWERLFQWANAHSLLGPEAQLITVSYDDPEITSPEKCRYYACISAPAGLESDRNASFLDIPAATYAICRLNCDADQIQPVYRAIYRDWLPDSGFFMADQPPLEIYYNAPEATPGSKYELDICVPLSVS